MLTAAGVVLTSVWALLVVGYLLAGRGRPWVTYRPPWAWWRAAIFFTSCFLVSWWSGTLLHLVTTPAVAPEHLSDAAWQVSTLVLVGFVVVAYPVLWVRWTLTFDRPRSTPTSVVFGILWGLSTGQLFLVVWRAADGSGLGTWWAVAVTYVVLGAWQYLWHSTYWDHYVTPEHDSPRSIRLKIVVGHVPNLALSLAYLAVWGDEAVVLAVQVIALTSAAVGMRLPPPWAPDSATDLAHRTGRRFPRVRGYVAPAPGGDERGAPASDGSGVGVAP